MPEPRLMMVEGPDDAHAVRNLFNAAGRPDLYDVRHRGGYQQVRADIRAFLKVSGLQSLAVVVDADAEVGARWRSLRDVFAREGYALPGVPPPNGLVLPAIEGRVAVGVWVMPDNTARGMLEDFAAALIVDGDALWPRAQRAVADIPAGERRFGPTATPKAEIHTWLAWQEDPGLSIGTAIKSRYLDAGRPAGAAFLGWAERLAAGGDARPP